jgi:hypothetical protein
MVSFIQALASIKDTPSMHTHVPPPTPDNWLLPIVIVLLGWGMSGIVSYFHADSTTASRLTALEIHQQDDSSRLQRVETSLQTLDDKVDKLLQAIVK